MDTLLITVLMFSTILLLMLSGLPVAFILGSVGIVYAFFLWGPQALNITYFSTMDTMNSYILAAVPLFIFMGLVLQDSGVADDLFDTIHRWAGGIRGGLGMGTIAICAIFAAMVGIAGAATVSMGIIALPAMLKRHYDKKIAVGLIMAGGALGFLIPPSVMMVMYAFLSGASVGKLFAGGIFPGLMLATMYIIYIGVRCYLQPNIGPALSSDERFTLKKKVISLRGLVLPGVLVIVVMGLIFLGVTSPTEASGVGALGALVCAAIHRKLGWNLLKRTMKTSLKINAMCFWIVLAAIAFSKVFIGLGAPAMIQSVVSGLGLGPVSMLILIQLIFFLMGTFLGDITIMFITMPIFIPIALSLGIDLTYFGILFVVNMGIAYITPPYGMNLFYMRAVAPPEVTLGDIYRSVIPFVALQLVGLALLITFPQIIMWLPSLIF